MIKLCECGCGGVAPLAKETGDGWRKGQPKRFIYGHHRRHGQARNGAMTPEYAVYKAAKARCLNPRSVRWKDYGGRGIKFLFQSFEEFFAELGPRPSPSHSLDRKENDGNYERGNVRWATRAEQEANKHRGACRLCGTRLVCPSCGGKA